jgi:hypothetical protein
MRPQTPPPTFHRPRVPAGPASDRPVVLLACVALVAVIGGAIYLLTTKSPAVHRTHRGRHGLAMDAASADRIPRQNRPPAARAGGRSHCRAGQQMAELLAELTRQRAGLDAWRPRAPRSSSSRPRPPPHPPPPPAPKPHAAMPMWRMRSGGTAEAHSHRVHAGAGRRKLPCVVETAINSEVEGISRPRSPPMSMTRPRDATSWCRKGVRSWAMIRAPPCSIGTHGSHHQLTLALPDGRSVDLGAPVTDQQGVAGLTGRVNHYWRLFGAVFIGGALRAACKRCKSAWLKPAAQPGGRRDQESGESGRDAASGSDARYPADD